VHLAAHVETTPRQPWRTAAVLGEGEQGLLRAADIPAAPVAAELVVLAGCRTAGNEVLGGEGLLGLGTGFLAAGVPVVLATLWDVDDHVTARIIADFYTALAAGHTAAGALAVAQRARRADSLTSAPWYWAGFVVLGDGARTVMVKPRRPAWPLIAAMLAAAAILASVATVGWRRRS
ncbi:MAG: CHAT domain-containing protein, partial [Kiritimatiellae bacterium]|nr:CHAT domain-containing protein [Kiritimatiellia bacterium]